jgi:hypothetical protein
MSKADDYRLRIEHSTIRAELSRSNELRQTWLLIRESYQHLLSLEASAMADLALDLAILNGNARARRH